MDKKEYHQFLLRNKDDCLETIMANSFLTKSNKFVIKNKIKYNSLRLYLIIDNIFIELYICDVDFIKKIKMNIYIFVGGDYYIKKEILFYSTGYCENYDLNIYKISGQNAFSLINIVVDALYNTFSINILSEHKKYIHLEKGKYTYSGVDDLNKTIFKINNIFSNIKCIDDNILAKMIEYFKQNNLCDYIDENIIMEVITNKKFFDKFLF